MIPATEVGGDYFDILPFEGGGWLGIGDVAGHGLHAGLVMMMIQSIVSATTHDDPLASPAAVWTALNAVLYDNVRTRLGRDEHATLTLIRYEDRGRLVYAGAHEDILSTGPPVGPASSSRPRASGPASCSTSPPAPPSIRSAGSSRATPSCSTPTGSPRPGTPRARCSGMARLCRAFEAAADGGVEEIRDRIMGEVRGFMSEQLDDLTLVVLRYR